MRRPDNPGAGDPLLCEQIAYYRAHLHEGDTESINVSSPSPLCKDPDVPAVRVFVIDGDSTLPLGVPPG